PDEAGHIIDLIEQTENELTIPVLEEESWEEKGLLEWIGNEIDHAYLEQLKQMSQMDTETLLEEKDSQIVSTPLHGTASKPVMEGLAQFNVPHVDIVEEQAKSAPEFSTAQSPNPEEHRALKMARGLGKEKDAYILLAT